MPSRRQFLACASAPLLASAQQATRPPNVILILTDDQGWWDVGANGNRSVETPSMDRLASEGVNYTRLYASPVCAPTRASLMTGRYYLRTGIYNTRFGGDTLDAREITLAELLRGRGYRTGLFGKWHLGHYRRYHPDLRGFDRFLGFTQGHVERYFHPDQLLDNGRHVRARGHLTDLFTDSAIDFVRENRPRPFFLYLAYNVPHSPNYVENRWTERYLKKGVPLEDAQIYGMLSHCDENIGRLMRTVDEGGLRHDTVVIFLSDNGGVSRHFRAGWRGGKGSAFEGGIRVPCFVRWPGHVAAGSTDSSMRAAMDLFPTILETAGAAPPKDRPIDGRSLFAPAPARSLFHIWDRHRPSAKSNWSVTRERFKLAGRELFDLEADPGEKRDLSATHPELAAEMRQEFDRWLAEVTRGRSFHPLPVEVGRSDENPVELLPSWASLRGTHVTWPSPGGTPSRPEPLPSVRSDDSAANYSFAGYDWDTIDGWRSAGDSAEWKIDVVRAGRYRVRLAYGCPQHAAGGRWRLQAGAASLEGTVSSTGGRNVFREFDAGEVALAKGAALIRMAVAESRSQELMALNRICLDRIA
ncbi:MAG: sulfatase-like hydrolase/transferase [Burkholderiales bacterium]